MTLDDFGNLGDGLGGVSVLVAIVALLYQRSKDRANERSADVAASQQQLLSLSSSVRDRLDKIISDSIRFSDSPFLQQCRSQAWCVIQRAAKDPKFCSQLLRFTVPGNASSVTGSFAYLDEHNLATEARSIFWNTAAHHLDDLVGFFVSIGNRSSLVRSDAKGIVALSKRIQISSIFSSRSIDAMIGEDDVVRRLRGMHLYWSVWAPALYWIMIQREQYTGAVHVDWKSAFQTLDELFGRESKVGSELSIAELEKHPVIRHLKDGPVFWQHTKETEESVLGLRVVGPGIDKLPLMSVPDEGLRQYRLNFGGPQEPFVTMPWSHD